MVRNCHLDLHTVAGSFAEGSPESFRLVDSEVLRRKLAPEGVVARTCRPRPGYRAARRAGPPAGVRHEERKLGKLLILPALKRFCDRGPPLALYASLIDRALSFAHENVDAAVREGTAPDGAAQEWLFGEASREPSDAWLARL